MAGPDPSCHLDDLPPHIRKYLDTFRTIAIGSFVVVPDRDHLGTVHIAEVTVPYHYFHDAPHHPYEFAHRLGVRWDRNAEGVPILYRAEALGVVTRGSFWNRTFYEIEASPKSSVIIGRIRLARRLASSASATVPASQPQDVLGKLKHTLRPLVRQEDPAVLTDAVVGKQR
jgi:hypothetical protein